MATIHMRNGRHLERAVVNRYQENGFWYGFVNVDGEKVEVCRDTTIIDAVGNKTYQWSEVQHYETPNDNSGDILTY